MQHTCLTDALIRAGIPYYVTRGKDLLETAGVMDAIAYLRLILDTRDDGAFERVVNKPPRGFGKVLPAEKVHPTWGAKSGLLKEVLT